MKLPHQFINVVSPSSNIDSFVPTPHPQLYQQVLRENPVIFSILEVWYLLSKRFNPL